MERLASHKKLLKALFQSAAEGILVVDASGSIVLANPRCLHMFGYPEEELIGKPLEVLVASELADTHAKFREGFFKNPTIRPMGIGRKLYGRTSANQVFPVEVSLSHMEVDGERYAIGFIVDITKQKQATDENILLSQIFHESLNDIYIIDAASFNFVKANTGALNNIGYSLEELQQLSAWDLESDQNRDSFLQRVAPLLASEKKKIIFESSFIRKCQSTFPVEIHLQLFEHNDQPVFMESVLDVTERKQAEAALRKEKETAQRYLDTAASIFVVLDRQENVVLINRKGGQVLGYTEAEIIGKNWFDHFLPAHEREMVREVYHTMMQGKIKAVEYFENAILTKDQEECLIEWHNAIIYDEHGSPSAVLSSGVDITEKRKAEKAMTQALIEGQELERKRIAKELHDGLGQSLTAIRLHLNALESDVTQFTRKNQDAFEKLKVILQTTTQEVKSISRDLMPNILQDYGLVKALEFLCQTINDTHTVQVQLQVYRMDRELGQAITVGLYRVAQELINNALKHAQATRIDIQLVGHDTSVVLTVEDDGIGFDFKEKPVANHSFGLRNIETRVKSLSGTFDVETRPGEGTLVIVEIPLKPTSYAAH